MDTKKQDTPQDDADRLAAASRRVYQYLEDMAAGHLAAVMRLINALSPEDLAAMKTVMDRRASEILERSEEVKANIVMGDMEASGQTGDDRELEEAKIRERVDTMLRKQAGG